MAAPVFKSQNIKVLSNVHRTFQYNVDDVFAIWNGDAPDIISGYNDTTDCIQKFLADALLKKKKVRAMGGNWSWTKVAFTSGWVLNTLRLNRMKRTLREEINGNLNFESDKWLFAQCGCSIQELNRKLRELGRSLKTSGASNGQTIAGAISNCTHGSAIDFGATPDFVKGLHIIVGPGRHVYLERESDPVVTDVFIQKIRAEHIKNDELFNAALVSFGNFGFIHGVMIETEKLFLLNVYRDRYEYDDVKNIFETLEFGNTNPLPKPGVRPFHFQVLVNPHDNDKRPYVCTMFKTEYKDYPKTPHNPNEAGPGEDAPVILGRLTNALPIITPLVVNNVIKAAYKKIDNEWGTHGEIFSNTDTQGRILSAAIGIPAHLSTVVNEIASNVNKTHGPFVGIFAYRYVKKTNALLGFTKFDQTCIAEFDSVEAPSTYKFYDALWAALDSEGISYSFHWGKMNNLNAARVKKIYGSNCDAWVKARNQLLDMDMKKMFENEVLVDLGLDGGGVV